MFEPLLDGRRSSSHSGLGDSVDVIDKYDYVDRDDGQPVYIGHALPGTKEDEVGWVIHKVFYSSEAFVTHKQVAYDSWDNRASATYA